MDNKVLLYLIFGPKAATEPNHMKQAQFVLYLPHTSASKKYAAYTFICSVHITFYQLNLTPM